MTSSDLEREIALALLYMERAREKLVAMSRHTVAGMKTTQEKTDLWLDANQAEVYLATAHDKAMRIARFASDWRTK